MSPAHGLPLVAMITPHGHANTMHGTLMIRQENDAVRHRSTLVARLSTRSASAKVAPLYDTMLLTSTGEVWTLAGYVRIAGGALQHEYSVAQSWIVTPAPLEDLRKAELEWSRPQAKTG